MYVEMRNMVEETSDWKVQFSLRDSPYSKIEIKNIGVAMTDVTFNIDRDETKGSKITGFIVSVPGTSKGVAEYIARQKAAVIFNYLSCLYEHDVKGVLDPDRSIDASGRSFVSLSGEINARVAVGSSRVLDIAAVDKVINEKKGKYSRQLSHFAKGLAATADEEKYREFYQVYEDEFGKPKKGDKNYGFLAIRHYLSHPIVGDDAVHKKLKEIFKKEWNLIDLNSHEDQRIFRDCLKKIQRRAKGILKLDEGIQLQVIR